jgi:hypothetical protein
MGSTEHVLHALGDFLILIVACHVDMRLDTCGIGVVGSVVRAAHLSQAEAPGKHGHGDTLHPGRPPTNQPEIVVRS